MGESTGERPPTHRPASIDRPLPPGLYSRAMDAAKNRVGPWLGLLGGIPFALAYGALARLFFDNRLSRDLFSTLSIAFLVLVPVAVGAIAVRLGPAELAVYSRQLNDTYDQDGLFQVALNPLAVDVGELNGDGVPDIVVAAGGADVLAVLMSYP